MNRQHKLLVMYTSISMTDDENEGDTSIGCLKSHLPKKKLEYLPHGLNERVDFFVNDRDMFKIYTHK